MMGWQWHKLDHMQIICTSVQTDNHASTSPLSSYKPDSLPAAQPTASTHWRQNVSVNQVISSITFTAMQTRLVGFVWLIDRSARQKPIL